MDKRNFSILVASSIIVLVIIWFNIYAFVSLGVDPLESIRDLFGQEEETVLVIRGEVSEEIEFSLSDLKSNRFSQVDNKEFELINAVGRTFNITYTGVSLWSILDTLNILTLRSRTFTFIASDGYSSEKALNITLAEEHENDIILAYGGLDFNENEDGILRSVINRYVIPNEVTTHFWVKDLEVILVN